MANKIGKDAQLAGDAVADFCQQMIDKPGVTQVEFEAGSHPSLPKFKIVIEKV